MSKLRVLPASRTSCITESASLYPVKQKPEYLLIATERLKWDGQPPTRKFAAPICAFEYPTVEIKVTKLTSTNMSSFERIAINQLHFKS